MINILSTLLITFLLFFSPLLLYSSPEYINIKEGVYYDPVFINSIIETKSISRAQGDETHVGISWDVDEPGGLYGKSVLGFGNFHEGGSTYWIDKGEKFPVPLIKVGKNRIATKEYNEDNLLKEFVLVEGNFKHFVASITIAGKYKDQNGDIYEFKSNGEAVFPDRAFKYEIILDTTFSQFDHYLSEGKSIGFINENNTLRLYSTNHDEVFTKMEKEPFLTLHRINK